MTKTATGRGTGSAGLGYAEPNIRQYYTGYEKDTESGLEFAQARYYNPTHGRLTSIDPLTASMNVRNPQTLNRYSYVLNSPYKYVDPLGLLAQRAGGGCGAEFSSCDSDGNGIGADEHSNRIYQAEVHKLSAQQAFARGNHKKGWRIIRESEGDLMALDQNGHAAPDPTQPTVTVEATLDPPSDNDLVAAAKAPTDIVDLERDGKIIQTNVKINLTAGMVSDLENDAIRLSNLSALASTQFKEFAMYVFNLNNKGYSISWTWSGGSILIRSIGLTQSGAFSFGTGTSGASTAIPSNIYVVANAYNSTRAEIRRTFAEQRSAF